MASSPGVAGYPGSRRSSKSIGSVSSSGEKAIEHWETIEHARYKRIQYVNFSIKQVGQELYDKQTYRYRKVYLLNQN